MSYIDQVQLHTMHPTGGPFDQTAGVLRLVNSKSDTMELLKTYGMAGSS